jgi:hypothetical protein
MAEDDFHFTKQKDAARDDTQESQLDILSQTKRPPGSHKCLNPVVLVRAAKAPEKK